MVHVAAGTDTYGRVKAVSGTPIVTRFAMFQYLPIYPLQSFYKIGADSTKTSGIPLIASTQTTTMCGIPLARVDVASVMMAYVRALSATMTLVGVIVFPLLIFGRQPPDAFARGMLTVMLISFVVGVVIGSLTYALPLVSVRERDIRQNCAELLGVAVDPARMTPEISSLMADFADKRCATDDHPRTRLVQQLIAARENIAHEVDIDRMEATTDELLAHLGTR